MTGYDIYLSDGSLLTTINVKTIDQKNSSSLILIGQGIPDYGTAIAQDFVWMLEHFANTTPPVHPLVGQQWYDTAHSRMNFYNGSTWSYYVGASGASVLGHIPVFNSTTASLIADPSSETFPTPVSSPIDLAVLSSGPGSSAISEIPAGVVQGLVSKMLVPNTYTQAPWPCTNYSAYLINENTNDNGASAVSYFSTAIVGRANSSVWNFNSIGTNVPSDPWGATPGAGLDFGIINGIELDFNICKVSSVQPLGQVNAIAINGASEQGVSPQGDAFAIHIYALNGAPLLSDETLTAAPWNFGFATEPGACIIGVYLNAANYGASQNSQLLQFVSTNSSSDLYVAEIYSDPAGNLNFVSHSGLVTAPSFMSTSANGYYLDVGGTPQPVLYYGSNEIAINDSGNHQAIIIGASPGTAATEYRNMIHYFQTVNGDTTLMELITPSVDGTTAMFLGVVNSAGYSVVPVTLGPVDSGSTGFRTLIVPN